MECFTKFCVYLVFLIVTIHGVTAALLTACTNTAACTASGGDPNAVCSTDADSDGNCICTGAFKTNEADDGCIAKGLLDVCTNTAACIVVGGDPNAICSNNVSMGGDANGNCICTGAFKNNANNNGCVAKEITTIVCTPGAPGTALCKKADPNSVCPSGGTKCKCKDGYKGTDSCTEEITTVGCTPDDNTEGTTKCQKVDENSECPAEGDKCACKSGYSGTDSCTKDAGSSATSAWITTSLIATSLLIYLPILIKW